MRNPGAPLRDIIVSLSPRKRESDVKSCKPTEILLLKVEYECESLFSPGRQFSSYVSHSKVSIYMIICAIIRLPGRDNSSAFSCLWGKMALIAEERATF